MPRLVGVDDAEDAAPSRLSSTPSWLIGQASVQAQRLLRDGLGALDSRGYHYRLLAALQEFGPASQVALGRRVRIDRSDVVAALNDLVAGGLVERSPDPADGRRNIVAITSEGAARLARLDAAVDAVQEELLAPLSPMERQVLVDLLNRILAHHPDRGDVG
jgi:DNA-binding MarR family transcriptional regulator